MKEARIKKSARSAKSARGFNKVATKICHPEERRATQETPQSNRQSLSSY
jgi:hypothetical protein